VEPVLVGPGAWIDEHARVGPGVAIGPEARVLPGVQLRDCVVWPGAEVNATSRHAVVTPRGTVQVPELDDPEAAPR
jgi:UDP-3-O-[3-hydroxymyristoyl] glucosamine N-acyltransferase